MKKDTLVIAFAAAVLVLFSGLFVVRFLLGGNEDVWLCEGEQWVKHGNPIGPMPPIKECMPAHTTPAQKEKSGMANPASVYCEKQGGSIQFDTSKKGITGYCILTDGTKCEEWAYFRSECP